VGYGVDAMTEPIAHVYKEDQRVLQLTNERLLDDFENNDSYRVEKV